MKIIQTTFDDVANVVTGLLAQQKEACVYCVADENCAVVGSNGGANMNEIQKKNIRLIQINHEGGTIILSPGDVDIGIFTEGYIGNEYRDSIVNGVIELVKHNGYSAVLQGNDILINGKKVIGFGSRMFGKILYTAIHISINANLELIESICTKPMVKVPDSLKNYGIKTEDILDIMFEVFDNQ